MVRLSIYLYFLHGAYYSTSSIGKNRLYNSTPSVTGSLIDSIIDLNFAAFKNAVGHLILPVVTLGLINAGPILKMTQATMERMLDEDFSKYGALCGLPEKVIARKALEFLPSVITTVSVLFGFQLEKRISGNCI